MIGTIAEATELIGAIGEEGSLTDLLSLDIPIPLDSSWLKVSYNIMDGEATVTFPNGTQKEYPVSIITMINWFRADSPGRFFNSEIKGK